MKIAMITDHLRSGGKERRMVELIKALYKHKDYEVTVIMLEGKGKEDIHYNDVFQTSVKFVYLGQNTRLQLFKQIYILCKREKYDLLHLWAPLIFGYILAPVHYFQHIPIICSSITSARKQGGNKFPLCKFTYHFYDKILSNSLQAFVVNEVPEKKAICIYNGFDSRRLTIKTSAEDIRAKYNIKTRYIISMAGEYSYRKDYPLFVNAANIVLNQNPDVTFLAMGSGDPTSYKNMIEPKFKDRIRFVGRVADVESVYNASDIVVLATTVEGVSNAIMEGMALGKPIVSTKGPYVGTLEVVEDGKSGFLTEYHDENAFSKYILTLLSDEKKRLQMGRRGEQIVKEKFTIQQMLKGFIDVYNSYRSPL